MKVNEDHYGYVYRTTNKVSGKTYVGQHKIYPKEPWLTYLGSGVLISLAVNRYGAESFSKELLSYAETKEILDNLERDFILKEKLRGKAEYNILLGNGESKATQWPNELSSVDLPFMYFEQKKSARKIAKELGIHFSVIIPLMRELWPNDSRLSLIKEGFNPNPHVPTPEELEKKLITRSLKGKKICSLCQRAIDPMNFNRHVNACSNRSSCELCGKTLSKRSAKRCLEHKDLAASMNKNKNGINNRGGLVTSHKRWHTARGIKSKSCILCLENERF